MTHSHPTTHHKGATERSARTLAEGEQSSAVAVAVAVRGGAYRTLHYAAAMVRVSIHGSLRPSTPKRGVSA